jgi:hypothetical protein
MTDPMIGIDPPPQNQGFVCDVAMNHMLDVTLALDGVINWFATDYMTKGWIEGSILKETQQKVTINFMLVGYIMDSCFGEENSEEEEPK